MEALFSKPFQFPDCAGRKVLVLGLGGGSDIIMACAVARLLPASGPTRGIIYANTKREREPHLGRVASLVYRVAPEESDPYAGAILEDAHGTTQIDHCVPRGDEGCPWIFVLERKDEKTRAQLAEDIRALGFDLLIGVDIGGDSLVKDATSGPWGRDQQMLAVLRSTGLPMLHVVVAPCSDGESSADQMKTALRERLEDGRFLGSFSLEPLLPLLRDLSERASLECNRTPRIILAAAEDRLEDVGDGRVVVPREREPVVPRRWLLHGFVFGDRPQPVA